MIWFILGVFGILIAFVCFVSLITGLVLIIQYTVQNGFRNTCRETAEIFTIIVISIKEQIKEEYQQAAQTRKRRKKRRYQKTDKYKIEQLRLHRINDKCAIQSLEARLIELEKMQYLTYCCASDNKVQIYANGAWRDLGDRDGA